MPKITLSNVTNLGGNPVSAQQVINTNSDRIEAAIENTLSRDGSTPNQMESDLDMNHYDVLNVGTLQVDDITIDGSDPTGILERALSAAQEAEQSEVNAKQSEISAADSADRAEQYALLAFNETIVDGFTGLGIENDYPLQADPGSARNIRVNAGGATQLYSDGAFSLIYSLGQPYLRINIPNGVKFEAAYGYAIGLNTPADDSVSEVKLQSNSVSTAKVVDGAITTSKLADDNVTFGKIQNISTSTLLGRASVGSGSVEELTSTQLRDNFFPAGSIIDSSLDIYSANTDLTGVIPIDDTIPQNNEGVEILSLDITPKSATNKLRIRFDARGAVNSGPSAIVWAIFNGGVDAISAGHISMESANYSYPISGVAEYIPGTTSTQTISVRLGSSTTFRLNGSSSGRFYGGVNIATLLVEEIKV